MVGERKDEFKRAAWLHCSPSRRLGAVAGVVVLAVALFRGSQLAAQRPGSPPPAQGHGQQAVSPQANLAAQPAPAVSAPAAPPAPDWPVNDRPLDAAVTWDSHGLRVVAANSSLAQILRAIATQTGATLEGLGRDQRVFGVYGPGPARDVIGQLLDGSGYNVLMVGELGQGTPRQIILTSRLAGGSEPGAVNGQNSAADDDAEAEPEPEPPAAQSQPLPPEAGPPGAAAVPVRSREQMLQELQQRQQQIQQMQQNPQ